MMKMTFGTKSDEMTDMDLILCEYQTKFYELLKICLDIDHNSNPSYIKSQIDQFKEKWYIDEL